MAETHYECLEIFRKFGLPVNPNIQKAKDIDEVMAAQRSLVETLARFDPRLVKMAPAGEAPED